MKENEKNTENNLKQNTNSTANKEKKKTICIVSILMILVLAIGICLGYFIFNNNRDEAKEVSQNNKKIEQQDEKTEVVKNDEEKNKTEDGEEKNSDEKNTPEDISEDANTDDDNSKTETDQNKTTPDSKTNEPVDYSIFSDYKGRKFKNGDYNTTTDGKMEFCELTFDEDGKPSIKMGYQSTNNTEYYFQSKEITYLKTDIVAGSTQVNLDFTASTPNGDATGTATIQYSNALKSGTMTVNATVHYKDGNVKAYNNIILTIQKQISQDDFSFMSDFKNTVYESEKKENDLWYKVEFNGNSEPTITVSYMQNGTSQIRDTYKLFSDINADGAAGSVYVTFNYRLSNPSKDKVEGSITYNNNTENNEIYLKLYDMENEIELKKVK